MRIKVIHLSQAQTDSFMDYLINDALKELEDMGNTIIDIKHSSTDGLLSVLIIYKPSYLD